MPIYRVNGNRYNIPDDKIRDFESYYPEAKVEIYDGEGGKYALPLSIRNEFQQRYEKWSYVTEETKKESPNTFVSNQNPQNTIISEDELGNSIADYEESLGHGKYGAANTPLFQKVRQSATSAEQIADGIIDKNWISKSPSPSVSQGNIGGVPEGRGVSNSSSNRTPVSDAYKSQFDKTIEDRFADARTRLEKDVVFQFENMLDKLEEDIDQGIKSTSVKTPSLRESLVSGLDAAINDNALHELGRIKKSSGLSEEQLLARKYISEARDVIEMYKRKGGNGLANFADAFARSFDSGILTLGATDAIDMGRVLVIANKIGDNGEGFEKLTKEEQQLMAAFSLLDQIQGSLQLDTWQNIGQGTMQSLPFLAQFALTGGVGAAASAATKAAAKTAVKKIVGQSASKAVSRIAAKAGKRAAGRVAMNAAGKIGNAAVDGLVGGTVMALTSGVAHTVEDVMNRMVGNHDIQVGSTMTPEGILETDYKHKGVKNRESLGLAFLKGFAANLIENGTEYMGNYMGLNLGKLLSRFKGGRQLLTKPLIGKTTRFTRQVGKLTGFNGFIPEVAEEELGMLLNAATVGDVEWKDISDPEQQFQTVMAVGIMSLGFQVANSIGVGLTYNKYRKAKKRYESKDLGEGLSVDDIIHGLDNVPLDRRADYVMAMVNTHDLGKGDAKDLQDFVMARTGYEFILGKIESDAEEAGDKAAEAEMRLINKEMGGKVTVTLLDGREAILTVGNVSLEPNAAGEYTSTTQSGSLIAVPVGIGNTPIMVSPKDIRSVSIMSTEDAVGKARAMAEDITKTNMASQIENEADEVESDEQSRTPSSIMSGGEIGELSPRDEGVEKQPLYRKSELEIGDVVTFKDYSDPDNPGVERTLKIIGIDDSGVDVEDVVDGAPLPLSIKPEQITHVKGKEKRQTTGGDEIRLWDYITYLDEETGKQKQGRVIEISPEGEISVQVRDEELNYPYTKYVSPENIIGKYKPQQQTGHIAGTSSPSPSVSQGDIGEVSAGQVEAVISSMKSLAEVAPEMELTPENWLSLFGEEGVVNTPLGEVNIGENQYFKLARQGREGKLGMVKPTLENPDVVVEERSMAKNGEKTERPSSYIFIKSFKKADGSRYYYFTSVTVSKDGNEVVISNQEKSEKRISKLLQNGKIAWINKNVQSASETQNGESVPLGDSQAATQADNHTAPLGIHSSEQEFSNSDERLTEPQKEGSDLVPTPNSISSDNKDNDIPAENQTADEKTDRWAKYRKSNGEVDEKKMPLREQFEYGEEIAGVKAMIEVAKVGEKETQSEIARLEKEIEREISPVKRVNKEKQLKSLNERLGTYQQYLKDKEPLPDNLAPRNDIAFRRNESGETPSGQTQINERESNSNKENSLFSQEEKQIDSQDEILQSIPQRERGTEAQKDRRMEEAERAIRRRQSSGTNETQFGRSQSALSRQEIEARAAEEYDPVGEGPFGEIYIQFKGKPREAIDFLMKKKSGEAIGALYHKDVGDIDLVWGKEGTGHSDGFGLAKLVKYHPEVLDNLQDILNDMQVTTRNSNRINLESTTHKATIRLEWDGNKKNWLLTAFEKENPASTKTTDTDTTSLRGGTALSQTGFSAGKDNTGASNKQEKPRLSTQKTLQERRQEIQEYIEREAGKLNIPVRIVGDVSQISPSEKNYTKKLKSQGWYDQTTGEIVIVAPNHGSIRDAQRTLLHEAVAHYGLPAMLGRENFDKLCDQVWDSMTDRERAVFGAYIDEKIDDKSYDSLTEEEKERYAANDFSGKRAAADEYLAHFAEEGITNPSLWSKIKRFIKEAFRKIGIDLSLTDSDIAYLLWKSKNRITDRDSTNDIIRKSAADTRIKENIGSTRFRMVEVYTPEEQDIIERALKNGTYMKAPNGADTNLTPKQWAQVRTNAFKDWFGDWENSPEKASKVVDENGEPMVVFHGTPLRRDQITPNKGWQKDGTYINQEAPFYTFKGGEYSGMIFASVDAEKARSIAEKRAMSIPDDTDGTEQWTEEGYVYDLFANVKNPFVPQSDADIVLSSLGDEIPTLSFYGGQGETVSAEAAKEILNSGNSWLVTETPQFVAEIKKMGYDGLTGTDEGVGYIACFNPNQLKDAYDNTGTFSTGSDDIRFRTIVVNPRYGSKIETVRTNHTSVYKAVDKYLRENFDEKDYTTHTAKTGSRYLELNIGNDTLKVRFANHTPRMEASDNMDTIGNGKEIAFLPGGDIEVEIDISLSGDRSKEIIDLIKGMKEYSSSEVKKEVSRLIDGAKTDPFPDVASPQLIEELSHYIGTEMAGTLDTQIAEYHKYRVNENVYKQESKSRDSKLKQNKYVLEQHKTIFRDFVQESPKLIKAVGGGYWYNGATGSIRIVPPFPIDYGLLSDKLMSSHFIPISGINKKEGKRQIVQEYVDEWSRKLTESGIFLSEEYVSEGAKITEAQQEIDNIREQYNFWVKAKLNTGTSADIRYRTAEEMEEVNQRFNEQLAELTEENADRIIMSLGRPSEILRSVDMPDRDIRLYGNKVMKKSKSHEYSPHDLKDLPKMIQHPIAIFKGSYPGSFSLLTEIELNGNNALVSIDIKKGEVQDINLVTSVYGKKGDNVLSWIEEGKMLYTDKKKTLDYISSSAPIADATYNQGRSKALDNLYYPAPIAETPSSQDLSTATNIVENFENPKLTGENSNGTMNTRFRREAPDVSSYIKISMDRKGIVDLSQLSPNQSQRIRKSAPAAYGAEISGDIASFPDYQEAENCLTYIFDNNDIISDDIRNSIDNGTLPQDIAMIFDAALRRGMARRVWIDRYQPLEALQKLISSTLGKEISEKENAWEYTGFMDSRIKAEADEYNADYYLPLLELYEKIIHGKNGVDEDTLVDYMLIKHGMERNQVMRREALEEWE